MSDSPESRESLLARVRFHSPKVAIDFECTGVSTEAVAVCAQALDAAAGGKQGEQWLVSMMECGNCGKMPHEHRSISTMRGLVAYCPMDKPRSRYFPGALLVSL